MSCKDATVAMALSLTPIDGFILNKKGGFGVLGIVSRNLSIAKIVFLVIMILSIFVVPFVIGLSDAAKNDGDDDDNVPPAVFVSAAIGKVSIIILLTLCLASFVVACVAFSRCR